MYFTWILPCVSLSCFLKQKTIPSYSRPLSWAGSCPGECWTRFHCPGVSLRLCCRFRSCLCPWLPSRALVYIDERGMLFREEGSFSLCVGPAFSWLLSTARMGWGSRSPLVQPGIVRAVKPQEGAAPWLRGASPPITTSLDLLTSSPATPA